MMRIAGFIVGSALAITALLIVLGVPRLPLPEPVPEPEPEPEPVILPVVPKAIVVPVEEPVEAVSEPVVEATRWHSFWSPFSSRIAANGFVSRLESVTGFDYRVVKVRAGVYEVAFAYTEEAERLNKLSVIATTAGLELPGT